METVEKVVEASSEGPRKMTPAEIAFKKMQEKRVSEQMEGTNCAAELNDTGLIKGLLIV